MRARRPFVLVAVVAALIPATGTLALASPPVPTGPGESVEREVLAGAHRLLVGRTDGTVTQMTAVVADDGTVTAASGAVAASIDPPRTDGTPRGVHVRRARFAGQVDDGIRAAHLARDVETLVDPYFDDSTGGALRYTVASQGNPASSPPAVDSCDWRDAYDVVHWAEALVGGGLQDRDEHLVLYTPAVEGCDIAWYSDIDVAVTWVAGGTDDAARWPAIAKGVAGDVMLYSSSTDLCSERWSTGPDGCGTGLNGDAYDVLGNGTGPLNGAHLDWLGLLDEESAMRVEDTTEVELEPVAGLTGRRFLVLPGGHHVEFRGAVGRDADLATGRPGCVWGADGQADGVCEEVDFPAGVVVRTGLARSDRNPSWSTLYDTSDQDPTWQPGDPLFVLRPGRSFVTADKAWRITTISVGETARVRVEPFTTPQPTITSLGGPRFDGAAWVSRDTTTVRWYVDAGAPTDGFVVLVDGEVAAEVGPDVRATTIPLGRPRNEVVVRALGPAGPHDSAADVVVVDDVAPWFSPLPWLEVRTGPVTTSAAPVRLRWQARDDNVVRGALLRSDDGTYRTVTGKTSYVTSTAPGDSRWTLEAFDAARNKGDVTFTRAVEVRGERLAPHVGQWASQTSTGFTHGTAMRSTTAGASLSLTTTARSIGWVAYTGPTSGRATVWVDGQVASVVDLRSATSGSRVVFATNFRYPGEHTVRVVVEGTAGRPTVVSDGFVIQR